MSIKNKVVSIFSNKKNEKRNNGRIKPKTLTQLFLMNSQKELFEVTVHDISKSGMSFIIKTEHLSLGEEVQIQIDKNKDVFFGEVVNQKIVHSAGKSVTMKVSIKFNRVLDPSFLDSFIAEHTHYSKTKVA